MAQRPSSGKGGGGGGGQKPKSIMMNHYSGKPPVMLLKAQKGSEKVASPVSKRYAKDCHYLGRKSVPAVADDSAKKNSSRSTFSIDETGHNSARHSNSVTTPQLTKQTMPEVQVFEMAPSAFVPEEACGSFTGTDKVERLAKQN